MCAWNARAAVAEAGRAAGPVTPMTARRPSRAQPPARRFFLCGGGWRREQAEGVLLFLGVVQARDRVQTVERSSELGDVGGLRLVAETVAHAAQTAHLVFDLGVAAAERADRIGSAERPFDDGHQLRLFGALV